MCKIKKLKPIVFKFRQMSSVSSLAVAVYGFIPLKIRIIEPAGLVYESHQVRDKLLFGLSTLPVYKTLQQNSLSNDDDNDINLSDDFMDKDDAKYLKYMSRLDPNDAKNQDHYRVLGLYKLRHAATANQIKFACKLFIKNSF